MLISAPTEVLSGEPGQILLPQIMVKNNTRWPWKSHMHLGMDESVDLTAMPIE